MDQLRFEPAFQGFSRDFGDIFVRFSERLTPGAVWKLDERPLPLFREYRQILSHFTLLLVIRPTASTSVLHAFGRTGEQPGQ
jgi:hypothetical protein